MSAFEIERHDVILTHFEHVQRQFSTKRKFKESYGPGALKDVPPRPLLSLLSDTHNTYLKPFQYVIVDEAQFAKKPQGLTHQAISSIPRSATIMLSGTFLDNKWRDCIGPISLLQGHPFADSTVFNATFASRTRKGKLRDPTSTRIKRIQKFLMAITIAHPKSLLGLKPVDFEDVNFDLNGEEERLSNEYFQKYKDLLKYSAGSRSKKKRQEALSLFHRAQQHSTHAQLHEARVNKVDEDWLKRMRKPGVAIGSSRMQAFFDLYNRLLG